MAQNCCEGSSGALGWSAIRSHTSPAAPHCSLGAIAAAGDLAGGLDGGDICERGVEAQSNFSTVLKSERGTKNYSKTLRALLGHTRTSDRMYYTLDIRAPRTDTRSSSDHTTTHHFDERVNPGRRLSLKLP